MKHHLTYHLTLNSGNEKTGHIPVSTSPDKTCPPSCGVREGCYAKSGPLAWHWRRVSQGERGTSWGKFTAAISDLPAGQLWRHNQAGDLPGTGDVIDARALSQLVKANDGKRGWTYTHKPVLGESNLATSNRASVRYANRHGFTINLSANNLRHADELKSSDCGPVVVVVPGDSPHTVHTPAGHRVVVCPAQRDEGVTCADCGLCARQRSVIVGFLAHGRSAKRVEAVCNGGTR